MPISITGYVNEFDTHGMCDIYYKAEAALAHFPQAQSGGAISPSGIE